MSIASEIQRLQQAKVALKEKINAMTGVPNGSITNETLEDFVSFLDGIQLDNHLAIGSTTVRTSASATATVQSNDRIRIHGNDGKAYTIAEWNTMWVENGYSTAGMPTPDGFVVTKRNGKCEVIYFESYTGQSWLLDGSAAASANVLPHSPYYTLGCVTAAASGTDYSTGKVWSISSFTDTDGEIADYGLPAGTEYWVLYTANTKSTFYVPKGLPYINALDDIDNFELRTEALYQISEWYRHRFAISSGITSGGEDGDMADVEILTTEGAQPAAGEDMYFWVGGENSNILAKYNLNNLHGTNSAQLTEAIRTQIYEGQKATGINMNDTGVNSAAKPVLTPGAKGAEAIAVDGVWYIITPYVTYASNAQRFADAPAVYYVREKGWSLPSQDAVEMWHFNPSLVTALRNYLVNIEHRTIPALRSGAIWCAGRISVNGAWYVSTSVGYRSYSNASYRYYVVGASGL